MIAFFSVGPMEIAVLAVIALLVLGPQRLPEAARSVGRGMRELREAMSGAGDDQDDYDDDEPDDDGPDGDDPNLTDDEDDTEVLEDEPARTAS